MPLFLTDRLVDGVTGSSYLKEPDRARISNLEVDVVHIEYVYFLVDRCAASAYKIKVKVKPPALFQ